MTTARKVTDEEGHVWECRPEHSAQVPGKDVSLLCTTPSIKGALRISVSWQWMKMAEKGLARLIAAAAEAAAAPAANSPLPSR